MKEREKKLEAVPVALLWNPETGKPIAIVYRWNDGTTQRLRLAEPDDDVVPPLRPPADPKGDADDFP